MVRDRNLLRTLLITLLSAVIVSVSGVVYTGVTQSKNNEELHQQQIENNRQWCELLTPLDNAYSSTPPATQLGRNVAAAIHKLRQSFEC